MQYFFDGFFSEDYSILLFKKSKRSYFFDPIQTEIEIHLERILEILQKFFHFISNYQPQLRKTKQRQFFWDFGFLCIFELMTSIWDLNCFWLNQNNLICCEELVFFSPVNAILSLLSHQTLVICKNAEASSKTNFDVIDIEFLDHFWKNGKKEKTEKSLFKNLMLNSFIWSWNDLQ